MVWRRDVEGVERRDEEEVEGEETRVPRSDRRPESTAGAGKGQQEIEESTLRTPSCARNANMIPVNGHGAKGDDEPVN